MSVHEPTPPRWRAAGQALYQGDRLVALVTHEETAKEMVEVLNGKAPDDRAWIIRALQKEANRIYNKQEMDYPSNVLDIVAWNLSADQTDFLSVKKHPSGRGILKPDPEKK
jgi:hypothetical protein